MATNKKFKNFKIFLQKIFVCNPLSMAVFIFFAPASAAAFSHRPEFSPLMGEVYGFLSYWFPWRCKKHWISYEGLENYRPDEQKRYCSELTADTLKQLSDEMWRVLWSLAVKYKYLKLLEMLMADRPSLLADEQVQDLMSIPAFELLVMYIHKGAIRYEQLKMLAHSAVYSHPTLPLYTPQVGDGGPQSGLATTYTEENVQAIESRREENCREFLGILTDYVKKHGTKADLLSYIDSLKAGEAGDNVKQAVNAALKVHEQCVFVSAECDNEYSDAWRIFCEKTPEICAEAQMRMSLNQYDMYHNTGHLLQADTIAYFIRKGNIDMCRKIFVNEPENGFINEEIAHLIHANREVQTLFYQILQELEKKK